MEVPPPCKKYVQGNQDRGTRFHRRLTRTLNYMNESVIHKSFTRRIEDADAPRRKFSIFAGMRIHARGSLSAQDGESCHRKRNKSAIQGIHHSNMDCKQKKSVDLGIKLTRVLDIESKMIAVEILKDQISSISGDAIEKYVFCHREGARYQIWALCTKGRSVAEIISVVVFRRHVRLGLIELNMIASKSSYCGEGFGSYFLHKMLNRWKDEGFAHVLTYADFCAVKFFEKMGFSHKAYVPRDLYEPWIDKYSLATLMANQLHDLNKMYHQLRSEEPIPVEMLVFYENIDRRPKEVWAPGFALIQSDSSVLVQYSYNLSSFVESLPLDSPRIRVLSQASDLKNRSTTEGDTLTPTKIY